MTNESFDQQDRLLMERLKDARERKTPPEILKGFSESVGARIREKQPSLEIKLTPKNSWIPAWVPVLAVLMIGSLLVLRMPIGMQGISLTPATVELAQANASQISDEIAALSEVGVWTEDDEKSAGLLAENDLEESELSKAVSHLDTRLP